MLQNERKYPVERSRVSAYLAGGPVVAVHEP